MNEGYLFVAVASLSANPNVTNTVWMKDSTVLVQSDNIQFNDTTLTIVSANRDDAGNYTITGTNDIGMGSDSFELDIYCKLIKNNDTIQVTNVLYRWSRLHQ